ncbi:MAG: addiction module protein [Bacteroidota bacterium]|nr:addiction module protein [Bacteroidota bacterium]MDP4232502.1 addiction module protein [Bacteroidota bacterium]MDP4241637.1 addiction module protein [Bacteroidota bacterium]MDP4286382.1 addiction module protein [Bacteroidota bacterium]
MDRDVDSILHDVRELDRESQIQLAEKIIAGVLPSSEIEAAQRKEVRTRVEAYRRGELKADDARPMLERARKMIADARKQR